MDFHTRKRWAIWLFIQNKSFINDSNISPIQSISAVTAVVAGAVIVFVPTDGIGIVVVDGVTKSHVLLPVEHEHFSEVHSETWEQYARCDKDLYVGINYFIFA